MLSKIVSIISSRLELDPSLINENSNLVEDLKADSIDIVEVIMEIEQQFDIEISDEDVFHIHTVNDILKLTGNI